MVQPPVSLVLDTFEVSEAFEVPLGFLMDPVHHERRIVTLGDISRTFYAMPYEAGGRRYFIWGATAAMLRNLYHLRAPKCVTAPTIGPARKSWPGCRW
jgi:hypothetical protein